MASAVRPAGLSCAGADARRAEKTLLRPIGRPRLGIVAAPLQKAASFAGAAGAAPRKSLSFSDARPYPGSRNRALIRVNAASSRAPARSMRVRA